MPRNPRPLALALTLALTAPFLASVAFAQFPGQDLPPQAQKGLEANITRHQDMQQMSDVDDLRKNYDDAELRDFVDRSMAKLTLFPDGRYTASAKPGGEFVQFKLGGKKFAVAGQTDERASWLSADGQFEVPRRSRRVHLTLEAGGREIPVDCAGMYEAAEEPVTFWVGDLRGLTCLGFPGVESPLAEAPVKTAALASDSSSPSPQD